MGPSIFQDVNISDVVSLIESGISVAEISRRLKISRKTIYKWLRENDLQRERFTNISDESLKEEIVAIKQEHPEVGEIMLTGHLRSRNIVVPRRKLRSIVREVDSAGVAARRTNSIRRRSYYSPAPNYVWHMDGLHKLIRWKFVIHGAVDGYSRLITFMKCSTNNKSETVFQNFTEAVQKHGMPLRVRTDHGGENQRVWEKMIATHNTQSAVIAGSSVHNVRIERMWRDVNRLISDQFREIFYKLESENILDPLNHTDLFCLSKVFLPLINRLLTEHVQAHNHHRISSEGNYTPRQLHTLNIHLLELHTHSEQDVMPDRVRNFHEVENLPHVIVEENTMDISHTMTCGIDRILNRNSINLTNAVFVYKDLIHYVGETLTSHE